jgi:hypothetical protein
MSAQAAVTTANVAAAIERMVRMVGSWDLEQEVTEKTEKMTNDE